MSESVDDHSSTVYITVIGDAGVGKTSLITAAATETFPDNPPPVLPPAKLPADTTPEGVPVVITDTSTRPEDKEAMEAACRQASVIVLCFRMEKLATLRRVSSYWMPELKRLNVNVPVLLVGCKSDLRGADQTIHQAVLPIVKAYPQIETCMECSAKKLQFVGEVFYYALKAVVYPMAPLYDPETQTLKPLCIRALKRVFMLCDKDGDGALNDEELNDFQVTCFNAPLQPEELQGVKDVVSSKLDVGLTKDGLTLPGFLFLHALFIERGRLETTWAVLTKFSYGKDLKLRKDILDGVEQFEEITKENRVQLSDKAREFFKSAFERADVDDDGALSFKEQEELFSTFPANPLNSGSIAGDSNTPLWNNSVFVEKTRKGLYTKNGFLAMWTYIASKSPRDAYAAAVYMGLPREFSAQKFFSVVKKKTGDALSKSLVLRCSLFAPDNVDANDVMEGLIAQSRPAHAQPQQSRVSVSVAPVHFEDDSRADLDMTLILEYVSTSKLASKLDSFENNGAIGDVAAFVFDWNRPEDFSSIIENMLTIASSSGDSIPCILIGLNEEDATATFAAEVQIACDTLGIGQPLGTENMYEVEKGFNVYQSIIDAAMNPVGHIPETPSLQATKKYRRMVARATMYIGVGTLAGVSCWLCYKAYKHYQSSSSSNDRSRTS